MAWRCSSPPSSAKSAATSSRRCAPHASSSAFDAGDADVGGDAVNAGDADDAGDADTSAPPPLARSGEPPTGGSKLNTQNSKLKTPCPCRTAGRAC